PQNVFVLHATGASTSNTIVIEYPEREQAPVPAGYVLVATFHTHPGLVTDTSDLGLTGYGPQSRAQMDPTGPQHFPMANLDPNHDHDFDRGDEIGGWAPACVPNQPKQPGASASFLGCFGGGHTDEPEEGELR
ncbi:hypothetical protein H0H92_007875, partial [Tricholoma furcatifolium]